MVDVVLPASMIVAPDRSGPDMVVVAFPGPMTRIVSELNCDPVRVDPPPTVVIVVGSVAVVV